MSAAQCNPLTENNYERCCIALNRSSILTPPQLSLCPPLTTSFIESVVDREKGDGRVAPVRRSGGGDDGGGGDGDAAAAAAAMTTAAAAAAMTTATAAAAMTTAAAAMAAAAMTTRRRR